MSADSTLLRRAVGVALLLCGLGVISRELARDPLSEAPATRPAGSFGPAWQAFALECLGDEQALSLDTEARCREEARALATFAECGTDCRSATGRFDLRLRPGR